jgi:hypothetical protein
VAPVRLLRLRAILGRVVAAHAEPRRLGEGHRPSVPGTSRTGHAARETGARIQARV